MPRRKLFLWLARLLVAGVCLAVLLSGVSGIPFHPDESTYLFLAQDARLYTTNPLAMSWKADKIGDQWQHYRLVEAPVSRMLIGLGLSLLGQHPLPTDWDWSKDLEANRQAGALPSDGQLWAGRFFLSLLLLPGLALLYVAGREAGGEATGLLAALLFGLSALTQLHARRVMGEAALSFSVILAAAAFVLGGRRAWLAGLCMALAFNSKHSALPLLPVGLLAVVWIPGEKLSWRRGIVAAGQYIGVFVLVTVALNPFLWRDPAGAVMAALRERQTLVQGQMADVERLAPDHVLRTPGQRGLAVLVNLYFSPPQFAEFGNVREYTAAAEQAYLAAPWHSWLRGLWGGGLLLILTLVGVLFSLVRLRHMQAARRRAVTLLLLCTLALLAGILFIVPMPWQRYVMPLAPFTSLWQGLVFARPDQTKKAPF
jgi:4-amino-4-deoxy-L-arabinose transferase-like glycosyltransferase